jgi:hypothetical protein
LKFVNDPKRKKKNKKIKEQKKKKKKRRERRMSCETTPETATRRHSDPSASISSKTSTTSSIATISGEQTPRVPLDTSAASSARQRVQEAHAQGKRHSSGGGLFAAPNRSLNRVISALNQQISLPQTPAQTPRGHTNDTTATTNTNTNTTTASAASSLSSSGSLGYSVPPLPANEAHRLDTLEQLRLLDTAAEIAFDNLVQLAGEICGTPIALMSLIDSNRQWFKSRVGLDADETPRSVSFCGHAIAQAELECASRFPTPPRTNALPAIRLSPARLPFASTLVSLCWPPTERLWARSAWSTAARVS